MKLLRRLQSRTLPKWQLIGFAITLFIGLLIIGLSSQVYWDIQQVFAQEKAIFGKQGIVVSKKISLFKSVDKERIYFTEEELQELRAQSFVEEVASFDKARFGIEAFTQQGENIPGFRTDLFFEAIPNAFLDVQESDWSWNEGSELIPIIVPQDYISLYNFGFAESQGLPVVSQNMIQQIEFGVRIRGNGAQEELRGRIVGFSEQINSILVPIDFLNYANGKYANGGSSQASRLLIRLNDPSSQEALSYFESENLDVNRQDMEQSRMRFFLNMVFTALFFIAGVIIVLSVSSILLTMNLLLYKNRSTINNLYLIAYDNKMIGKFYFQITTVLILVSGILAILCTSLLHSFFQEQIGSYFEVDGTDLYVVLIGTVCVVLIVLYKLLLARKLRVLNEGVV